MGFVTALIVAASLMSDASLSVQDRPDFSGVWRLDAAKTVTTRGPLQLEAPGVRTQSLPKRLKGSNPSYPSGAMASPLAAVVIVQTVITAQGDVASLTFVNSVPAFNRAVAEAVSKWKYEPTLVNGMAGPGIAGPKTITTETRWIEGDTMIVEQVTANVRGDQPMTVRQVYRKI